MSCRLSAGPNVRNCELSGCALISLTNTAISMGLMEIRLRTCRRLKIKLSPSAVEPDILKDDLPTK